MAGFHDFRVKTIDGDERSLADFRGRVCLVVNGASRRRRTRRLRS